MKTIIIYNEVVNQLKFTIVEGDYSRFNNVKFNYMEEHEHEVECAKFLFNDDGYLAHIYTEDVSLLENKSWDKVAIITFLP